jgi:hypothetical protein
VPETLPRIVIARAVKRRGSVDQRAIEIAMESSKLSVAREIKFVATMALRIMFTEPSVISLGLCNGFAYGLLFLYLDGVFDVFVDKNGLSYVGASLTYLNFCVGVTITFCFVPVQTYLFRRDPLKHGQQRPAARFLTSLVCVWLFLVSLFRFAFTCDGKSITCSTSCSCSDELIDRLNVILVADHGWWCTLILRSTAMAVYVELYHRLLPQCSCIGNLTHLEEVEQIGEGFLRKNSP